MNFLSDLEPMLRTYWFIALPTSIIFLLQSIMTFIGVDATDGLSADFDGDTGDTGGPFQLFSFRNLINFLLGFGWGGISFYSTISNKFFLGVVAVIVGLIFLFLFFAIIKQLKKLEEDNTFKLEMTLNKTGSVYLTIPKNGTGQGAVQVSVNGSVKELNAITRGEKLESGAIIRVIGLESDNLLLVEKI
jgi:hypothetical protein